MSKAAHRRRARQTERVTATTSTVQPLISGLIDTTNERSPSALREPTATVPEPFQVVLAGIVDFAEHAETTVFEATTTACDPLAPVSASVVDQLGYGEIHSDMVTTNATRPLTPDSAVKENLSPSPSPKFSVDAHSERGHSSSALQAIEQSQRTDSLSPSRFSPDKEWKAAGLAAILDTTGADTSSSTSASLAGSEGTSSNTALDDSDTVDSGTVSDEACVRTISPAPASPTDRYSASTNAAVSAFKAAIHARVTYGTFVDTSAPVLASPRLSESTPEDTFVDDSVADGGVTVSDEAYPGINSPTPAAIPASESTSEDLIIHESQVDDRATNSDPACDHISTPVPAPLPANEDTPKVTTPAPSISSPQPTPTGLTKGRLPTLDAMVACGYLRVIAGSSADEYIKEPFEKPEEKEVPAPPREEPLAFDDRPHYLWADIAYYDKRHQVHVKKLPEAPVAAATRRGVCDEARLETPACGYSGCVGWM